MVRTAPATEDIDNPTQAMVDTAYSRFLEHTQARDDAGARTGLCVCGEAWTCAGRTWAAQVLRNAARRDLA